MSVWPEPPRGEFDADGRHVHPYVRDPRPDYSAPGYKTLHGEEVTQEDRSRESRVAFHTIEDFLGFLTPLGMAFLMQALVNRLYTPTIADELAQAGRTVEELDPRDEILAFEELHEPRLRAISDAVDAIVETCPSCGRQHGEGCEETLQPGAYVNAATADSVSVWRVATAKVYAVGQVDHTGREIDRVYDREWFEEHFVPADDVQVLGGPAA
jgi:hypothetical protein